MSSLAALNHTTKFSNHPSGEIKPGQVGGKEFLLMKTHLDAPRLTLWYEIFWCTIPSAYHV